MIKEIARSIAILIIFLMLSIQYTYAETPLTPDFNTLTPSDIKAVETLEAADDYRNGRCFPSAFIHLSHPRMSRVREM